MLAFGCAPEIQSINPVVVACDQIIAVQGKHMDEKISVSVAGVEVPHSGLEITDKEEKVGYFQFRMPFADRTGKPLSRGAVPVAVRVGSASKVFEVDLDNTSVPPPVPAVAQKKRSPRGVLPRLILDLYKVRRPIQARLIPIVPDGPPILLSDAALRSGLPEDPMLIDLRERSQLLIHLPADTLENTSFKLQIGNSPYYGGKWSEPTTMVFIR